MKKIIVGISGGVDSSVTAFLLKKLNYDVTGIFMNNWNKNCQNNIDLFYAKEVCKQINIKLIIVDFSYEYWNKIFLKFIKNIKNNKTPNPDILCNKLIKFDLLINYCLKFLKIDLLATGHYVGKEKYNKNFFLCKADDKNKDQCYFLNSINKKYLKNCLFPLQYFKKNEVRDIAKKYNLITAYKSDSYGLCFVSNKKFNLFISKYINNKIGFCLNNIGNIIYIHNGLFYFTIGQRRGLNIGHIKNTIKLPWYVNYKIKKFNFIIIDQIRVKIKIIFIKNINFFINFKFINEIINIQICNLQKDLINCIFIRLKDDFYKIILKEYIFSMSYGQYISIYLYKICIGGGEIVFSF